MEAARDFAEQNLLRSEGSVMAAVADVRRAREGPREARMATERMDESDQRSGPEPDNSTPPPLLDDLSSVNPSVAAAAAGGCINSTEDHSSTQDQEVSVENKPQDQEVSVENKPQDQEVSVENKPQEGEQKDTEEKGEPSKNPRREGDDPVPELEEEDGRQLIPEENTMGENGTREPSPEVLGLEDCVRAEGDAELLLADRQDDDHDDDHDDDQPQGRGQGRRRLSLTPYLDDNVLSLRPAGVNRERPGQARPGPARSLLSIGRRMGGLEMTRADLRGDRTMRQLLAERVQRLEDLGRGRRSQRIREREASRDRERRQLQVSWS